MAIGTAIFLIAVGAILRFAVYTQVHGASISTIGIILMIVGALGLVLSFTVLGPNSYRSRQTHTVRDGTTGQTIVREETVSDTQV